MGRYERSVVFCECCETETAVRDLHEPGDDGMFWIYVECRMCGFSKVVRDDWHPEYEGVKDRPPDDPPKGLLSWPG